MTREFVTRTGGSDETIYSFEPLIISQPGLCNTDKLNFIGPDLTVKKVIVFTPMQTNLIRLLLRMPSEMRMVAGYNEADKQKWKTTSWLDGLRNRLKTTEGKQKL